MVAPDGKSWNFWRENPRQLGMQTLECTWLGQAVFHWVFHQIWGKGSERHSSFFFLKSNASLINWRGAARVWARYITSTLTALSRKKAYHQCLQIIQVGYVHVRSCPLVAVLTCGSAHCGCGPRKVLEVCFSIHSGFIPINFHHIIS